jgi:hypothetical protein
MNLNLPKTPQFPAKPLQSEAAEADAQQIASIWKTRGQDAAVLGMFMWQWQVEPRLWESSAMADRIRTLAAA